MPTDHNGTAAIHSPTVYQVCARWSDDNSLTHAFIASVVPQSEHNSPDRCVLQGDGSNMVATKGDDGLGYAGHQHQKGEQVIAIIANNGSVLAPLLGAPVKAEAPVWWPEGFKASARGAKLTDWGLQGSYLPRDGGGDATANRQAICKAGMRPHIKENPHNRPRPKRGRKRLFHHAISALRDRVEGTLAWEDKFQQWLLRCEHHQRRHYGMKLMAYTLINVKRFYVT